MGLGTDNAYAELGLAPGASEAEVKVAWRRLASQWHPDRNGSATAIGRMQRINQAIEQIRRAGFSSDTDRTADASAKPPQARDTDTSHQQGHERGPFEKAPEAPADDFETAGAASPQSRTISRKIRLTLEEAAAGCVKPLRGKLIDRCVACAGAGYHVLSGACSECAGTGAVRQRSWYGWGGVPVECAACRGDGIARQSCDPCNGAGKLPARDYRVNVRIPIGVRDGDQLHVRGRRSQSGHPAVHLDLRVKVLPHALFKLDTDGTIRCDVPVDGFAWIANRSIDVPTLSGFHSLQLSRDQLSYRLSGQGFPTDRRSPPGDHLVRILPTFPDRLDTDQEILLDQLVASSTGSGGKPLAPRLSDWHQTLRELEKARSRLDR